MEIKVHYLSPFMEITEAKNEIIKTKKELTIAELLEQLVERYGERFAKFIYRYDANKQIEGYRVIIKKNDYLAKKDDFIKDGDQITLITAIIGG